MFRCGPPTLWHAGGGAADKGLDFRQSGACVRGAVVLGAGGSLPLSLRCFRARPADAEQRTLMAPFHREVEGARFCGCGEDDVGAGVEVQLIEVGRAEGEADGDGSGGDGSRCRESGRGSR